MSFSRVSSNNSSMIKHLVLGGGGHSSITQCKGGVKYPNKELYDDMRIYCSMIVALRRDYAGENFRLKTFT